MSRYEVKVDEVSVRHGPQVSVFLLKSSGKFYADVRGQHVEGATLAEVKAAIEVAGAKVAELEFRPVILLDHGRVDFWRTREAATAEGRKRGGSFGVEFWRVELATVPDSGDIPDLFARPFLRPDGLADGDIREDEEDRSKLSKARIAELAKVARSRVAARKEGRDRDHVYSGSHSYASLAKVDYTPERWEALLMLERMVASAAGKLDTIVEDPSKLDRAAEQLAAAGGHALLALPAAPLPAPDPLKASTWVGRKVRLKRGTANRRGDSFEVGEELEVEHAYQYRDGHPVRLELRALAKGRRQRPKAIRNVSPDDVEVMP